MRIEPVKVTRYQDGVAIETATVECTEVRDRSNKLVAEVRRTTYENGAMEWEQVERSYDNRAAPLIWEYTNRRVNH